MASHFVSEAVRSRDPLGAGAKCAGVEQGDIVSPAASMRNTMTSMNRLPCTCTNQCVATVLIVKLSE